MQSSRLTLSLSPSAVGDAARIDSLLFTSAFAMRTRLARIGFAVMQMPLGTRLARGAARSPWQTLQAALPQIWPIPVQILIARLPVDRIKERWALYRKALMQAVMTKTCKGA